MKRILNSSIRTKIILLALIILIFSLSAVGVFFFRSIYTIYHNNAHNNLHIQSRQLAANINNFFYSLDALAVRELSDPMVMEIFREDDEVVRLQKFEELSLRFEQTHIRYRTGILNNILSVYIFFDAYNYINLPFLSVRHDEHNIEIFRQAKDIHSSGPLIFPPTASHQIIYFVRNVYNLPTYVSNITLIYGISEGSLNRIIENSATLGNSTFLIDREGVIFSAADNNLLGTRIAQPLLSAGFPDDIVEINMDGVDLLVRFERVAWEHLVLVNIIPREVASDYIRNSFVFYFFVSLAIIVTCIALSFLIIRYLTRFIKEIITNIEQIGMGNYKVRMRRLNSRDLMLVSETFNSMAEKISYLIDDVHSAELAAKESELRFLQSQMNPHFLINVLTTIRTKAKLAGNETVNEMLLALNELLSAGVYADNSELITLKDELNYVRQYLYLQKMRFQDRLNYKIFVHNDEILNCSIPKLAIETIVENSVVHGIENRITGGNVNVFILHDNKNVYVFVIDDGVGFDVNSLDFSNESIAPAPGEHKDQIGLKNTDRRLKLAFGEEYGLFIDSDENEGTCVVFTTPITPAKGEDEYV